MQNTTGSDPKPISDELYALCTSSESVSSILAKDPTVKPGDAWKKLYGHELHKSRKRNSLNGNAKSASDDEILRRTAECGKWGPTQPSELFLRLFNDALHTVDEEGPEVAMVSPSLMGSCGTLPLTIISTVPDIARHMSNLIARAEREVYLATNYWQNGIASKFLTDAMKELSRRAGQRGTKIIMKIIYDRGSPRQMFEPHFLVSEKTYTGKAVGLPHPHEIPHIDLEVINYHQPMLGTFHAKYMVVDRKIAVLQSNNIQDNDNVEMMVHLEGPIVDSLYDMALISWRLKLMPPLPSHDTPAASGGLRGSADHTGPDGNLGTTSNGNIHQPGVVDAAGPAHTDDTSRADAVTGPSTTDSVTHPQGMTTHHATGDGLDAPTNGHSQETSSANRMVSEKIARFLGDGEPAIPQQQIADPTSHAQPLPEHTTDDPHWDDDIAGEVARVQASVSGPTPQSAMDAITRHLNHTTNRDFKGRAPPFAPGEEMTPYIPHATHEPFPMALVNRPPYGPPNHKSVSNPQNAAWLSALRNAQKNVFIQSPTLNAEPLIPAIIEACERGIDVFCYICLGYNDTGELLPMQGGHNEMVAHNLYKALSPAGRQHLHYFWYVARDQTVPIVQAKKKRSCHVKLMIADERVGIIGNGNQDTQSWFHSQEINVMVDSPEVCRAWIDGLRRNQNTHLYGELSKEEGVWRDGDGKEAEGVIGVDPGRFSWAKGLVGAVKRVQGTGGF
ncbi:hypothetical protein CONLIGDRAFT_572063 [Coniochaeta ligniaria NRRL 30616]|uniref:PLD phosphodiesterase domain-containing protein n=1 Tax=Coniochaeta ligniaria NRRL 30616 TaxID=1408157 RepID=A0A1J7JEZ8_9PEZI|nr:hypothetical protein CONLIGDRAFT_572063 [Coniochaeta ligniaria NRRL 30616]